MDNLYKILNNDTKDWWYYKLLRRRGLVEQLADEIRERTFDYE